MEINSSETSARNNKINEDDIDLKALIKFLIRNKNLFFFLVLYQVYWVYSIHLLLLQSLKVIFK